MLVFLNFTQFSTELKEIGSLGARKYWTQNLLLQLHFHFTYSFSSCISHLQHFVKALQETTTKYKLKSSWNWELYYERKKNYWAQTPENLTLTTIQLNEHTQIFFELTEKLSKIQENERTNDVHCQLSWKVSWGIITIY